ncbi:putative arabinan endo-1 [Lasiodiplodia hormozganensis]|uniref:Arabinan endo-1 n=1 Tax=Lasiodiplodia hormozganensis TaxID=869390 RepID=A0AA39Z516_9PEZI|nr:putative arabinan endo-1 [Lasiodiplodia hormozganensis]
MQIYCYQCRQVESNGTYVTGPVMAQNFPDPSIVYAEGYWWAFATMDQNINIQVARSSDFQEWTYLSGVDALPDPPNWVNMASPNTWAPDVNVLDDGTYVMYFSATTTNDTTKHCVGAAKSNTVEGPYTPVNGTLACPLDQGGAIDASGFKDWETRGTGWGPGNAIGNGGLCGNTIEPIVGTPLMLLAVAADGVTPQGSPVQLLDNAGVSDDGIVEAPALVKTYDGEYVLFFSSGCYSTDNYTVSFAMSSGGVTGPYQRADGPLLKSGDVDGQLVAPGGMDVHWDATRMVFHERESAEPLVRQMWAAQIKIGNGTVQV